VLRSLFIAEAWVALCVLIVFLFVFFFEKRFTLFYCGG
jgi:hypothetical protein